MDEQKRNEFQEEDLERYGVWVKAGPEEVVDAEDDYSFADLPSDTSPPEAETDTGGTAEGETSSLDKGEEDFDFPDFDDIDLVDDDEPAVPAMDLGGDEDELGIATPSSDTPVASDDESLDALEDFDTLEETAESEDDLVSLDDLDLEVPDEETDPFSVLRDDSDADEPSDADRPSDEKETSDEEETEEFDLEELTDTLDDDFEELDIESPELLAESAESDDDAFDSTIPGSDDELDDISLEDIGYEEEDDAEELPELVSESDGEHDFTPEDQGIEIVDAEEANQITPEEEAFLAEEEDLQNADESAIQKQMDTQEREAFERIQTELHDIKRELAELKEALRGSQAGHAHVSPAIAPEEPDFEADDAASAEPDESGELHGSGFFEEDEDETIALTGDELDNILNTAEFTEQAGQEEELDDDFIVDTVPAEPEKEEFEGTDVSEIEMEPVEDEFSEEESEDPAVSELAEMDIDQELADIEELSDDTSEDEEAIEIDLDSLDEIEDADFGTDLEPAEPEAEEIESAAPGIAEDEPMSEIEFDDDLDLDIETPDEEADELPETDTTDTELEEDTIDEDLPSDDEGDFDSFAEAVEQDLAASTAVDDETGEIDEIELSDDFDDEEIVEEPVTAATFEDEEDEIELDLDDLEVEDVDLDEEPVSIAEPTFDEEPFTGETGDELEEIESTEPDEMEQVGFEDDVRRGEPGEIDVEPEIEHEEEEKSPLTRSSSISDLPDDLKEEIRSVLSYMDQLLEALPDDKIEEFAQSEHFDVYKRLFEELGLET